MTKKKLRNITMKEIKSLSNEELEKYTLADLKEIISNNENINTSELFKFISDKMGESIKKDCERKKDIAKQNINKYTASNVTEKGACSDYLDLALNIGKENGGKLSISLLQRKLSIGFPKASLIVDKLINLGKVSVVTNENGARHYILN